MSHGFISRALLIAFVAALAVVPLSILAFPYQHQASNPNDALLTKAQQDLLAMLSGTPTPVPASQIKIQSTPSKKQNTALITVGITIVPSPSNKPIAMEVQSFEAKNPHTYTSYDRSFSFVYPSSWSVSNQTENNFYTFFFSPSASSSGQNMNILVFNPAQSAQEVIKKNYPQENNNVTIEKFGSIGNKLLYKVTSSDSSFGSFGIILAQKHAYAISFDDNGDRSVIDQIEKQVWPTFKFE